MLCTQEVFQNSIIKTIKVCLMNIILNKNRILLSRFYLLLIYKITIGIFDIYYTFNLYPPSDNKNSFKKM